MEKHENDKCIADIHLLNYTGEENESDVIVIHVSLVYAMTKF